MRAGSRSRELCRTLKQPLRPARPRPREAKRGQAPCRARCREDLRSGFAVAWVTSTPQDIFFRRAAGTIAVTRQPLLRPVELGSVDPLAVHGRAARWKHGSSSKVLIGTHPAQTVSVGISVCISSLVERSRSPIMLARARYI